MANGEGQAEARIRCAAFSCERVYGAGTQIASLSSFGFFRVCLITHGAGSMQVFDREIPCSKGDICIIPPNVPHDFFLSEAGSAPEGRVLEFTLSDWFGGSVASREHPEYCYGVFRGNKIVAYATLNAAMQERICGIYDCVESELSEKKRGWAELIRCYLTDLLISVSRYIDSAIKNPFSVSSKEWNVVSSVIGAVQERYGDSALTLNEIANSLYISQSQVSRILKKTMGTSFSHYLGGVRIGKACELLRVSRLRVEDVAGSCGFRDLNAFYRAFSAAVGMTPSKYRQAMGASAHEDINKKTKNREKIMVVLSDISENLQKGKAKIVKELVEQAINEGANPEEILNEGLLAGMNVIGEKFKNNEIYVPEVLVAARAMNMGAEILKPHLAAQGVVAAGKVCIGTVQGDLHDIGKNLVKMMMEGKGLEVVDLGTDVSPETFVQAVTEQGCQVICCSALLTTTMGVMADVVKAAEAAGIRDKVKIMIGGAPITDAYCKEIGADCYTPDAASAADKAVEYCTAARA